MIMMVIANIIGILFLFFMLWRTLKEDYHYEKVFNLAGIVVVFQFVFLIISKYILSSFWFWLAIIGTAIGFVLTIKKQKMKFFESFEALVIGMLPWISLIYANDAIYRSSLSSFLSFWITILCIFLYFFLDSIYRGFNWYKSGRVGFSGIVTAIVFFVSRGLLSLFFRDTMSFAGSFEIYFSLSTALLLTIVLYNLSRKSE